MLVLKHLKALQHVSIIIQIIFRELVCSLLKSLNLKECLVCVCVCVLPERTHIKRYAATSPHLTVYIINKLLNPVTLTRNILAP